MSEKYADRVSSPRQRAIKLLADARYRSKRRGLPEPEISAQTIEAIIRAGRCQVTGLPFCLEPGPEPGKPHPYAPSLDQKVPGKGYTLRNTRVVLWAYNAAKQAMPDDSVLLTIAAALMLQVQKAETFRLPEDTHP